MRTKYEMFSPEGNKACEKLVQDVCNTLGDMTLKEDFVSKAKEMIVFGVRKIEKKHPEVFDTEPQYLIVDEIKSYAKKNYGITMNFSRFDLDWDLGR